ncbi:MAG: Hpt domain-containing protein, partial [Alphaproteobacteria bacterium]
MRIENGSDPVSREVPLDITILAAQSGGDKALERQVLELFVVQVPKDVTRLREAAPDDRLDIAHRIVGSARAVGAVHLAKTTARFEATGAVGSQGLAEIASALDLTQSF